MIRDFIIKKFFYAIIFSLLGLSVLAGCNTPADYKADADERVYNIIDRKWDESFGSQVNYKIGDTEPAPGDIHIEKAIPASGILTIPQAVALATAHNRQYQFEKELLYTTALDLRLARHEFEPHLFGGAREGYGKEGDREGMGGEADLGFDRLLADGTRIGTKLGIAWFKVITGDVQGGLASILTATVTKPLLRGSNPEIVRENLTQAERNTLYQLRLFNRFRKTFVVSIITQYYLTLQLLDAANNAQDNYNTLTDLSERVEKLTNAGRLPSLELERVWQEKLQAQDRIVEAQKLYKQALDEFKISLGLPTTVEFKLDPNELEALRVTRLTPPDFAEDLAVETALNQRLDLANYADIVADAERKVLVASDALGGELGLYLGVDATSLAGATRQPGVGGLDDDFSADRNRPNPLRRLRDNNPLRNFRDEAEIGIDGDLPLDRVLEQNIYRKALIARSQCQRQYEEMADWVKLEVRQAYRDLTEAAERYRLQSEGLGLARKRYENTLLLLQYRRTNSRRVLRAQRDFFDAQNAATEALVNYTIATLNFYRDTEVLQVRPDGMWQL
ncbi:MAG: TolC family protein [Planctomycetota bacterium]|nr:MAG: TolC family protein [Planctomycetota bacterium]